MYVRKVIKPLPSQLKLDPKAKRKAFVNECNASILRGTDTQNRDPEKTEKREREREK